MKIVVTAVQYSSELSGIQRHAFNMVRCLLKQPEVSEIHFVVAPWQLHLAQAAGLDSMDRVILDLAKTGRDLFSRNLWYFSRLPELIAQIQPDIVQLSYPVPIDRASIVQPVVLTLHDLYPFEIPENFGLRKAVFNRAILKQCLRGADAVACVSDTTLSSLQKYFSLEIWQKASRIYNCIEPEPSCSRCAPLKNWVDAPFLLTIAQHRKNKNIPLAIRVLHRLLKQGSIASDTQLIVVGIAGPETRCLEQLVKTLRVSDHVHFVQGLSESQLQWCYRNCESLIAPSVTEGFGLPVAEALLAGCRVVCSDIPAFREIGSNHCQFVALGKTAESHFALAIETAAQQPLPLPLSLPQFSSTTLGAEYLQLYRGVIASRQSRVAYTAEQLKPLRIRPHPCDTITTERSSCRDYT